MDIITENGTSDGPSGASSLASDADLDSFMAELNEAPAAAPMLPEKNKTHVQQVSLDAVALMNDDMMNNNAIAALELKLSDLERAKNELSLANDRLKQQYDGLNKTYMEEKSTFEMQREQQDAQLDQTCNELRVKLSEAEQREAAECAQLVVLQSQFQAAESNHQAVLVEKQRLEEDIVKFMEQLADFEAARRENEKLKVTNAELTKLAADNAKRLEDMNAKTEKDDAPVEDRNPFTPSPTNPVAVAFPTEERCLSTASTDSAPDVPIKQDRADESAQAEVKRLLSRVQFLESMLKGKEDSIVQLEGRMEELRLERDSYREAMMKVFEESHPDDKLPPRPPPPANGTSGLDDSIRYALGYGSDSLMGAIGNLGVASYLAPAVAAPGLDQSTGKASQSSAVAGLQEQVADLTKQLLELKHLAKNKDKIEELERRAAQAEGYTKEAQEVAAVTDQLSIVQLKCNEAVSKKEEMEVDLGKARKQSAKDAKKAAFLSSEINELKSQLEYTKNLVRETEERLVDPIVVRNLEDKMNELTVEKTHWQKKAQSLSKDMLRVLASVAELDELKHQAQVLRSRNEELQNERNMFREMMEAAVQTPTATPPPRSVGESLFSGMNRLMRSPIRPPDMK